MTKEELFERNTLMAYKIANKYRINYLKEYDDIKQEALVGLWKACEKYNDSKGAFSTYAYICISNNINIYIRHLRKHENREISLFAPIGENLYLEDTLGAEDENIERLEDRMILNDMIKNYNNCFENDQERKVYKLFLSGKKQKHISNIIGISQTQISRIEKRINNRINKLIII